MSQMKTLVLAMGLSLAARGAVAQAPEMAMAQAVMRQAAPPAAWARTGMRVFLRTASTIR